MRHKVILKKITLKSDLRNIAISLSALEGISKKEAVEILKVLPHTMIESASTEYARKIEQLFADLGAEVDVQPPLPAIVIPSLDPVEDSPKFRLGKGVAFILSGILLLSFVLFYFGSEFILSHFEPSSSKNTDQQIRSLAKKSAGTMEGAHEEISAKLAAQPGDEGLLLQKAIVFIGIARHNMNQESWAEYGTQQVLSKTEKDLFKASELDSAINILTKLQSRKTVSAEANRWLGEVYLQKALFSKALTYVQKAIELDHKNVIYWNLLATVYQEQENIGQAHIALRKAYSIDSTHLETLRNLGVLSVYHLADTLKGISYLHKYLHREAGKDMDRYFLRQELMSMVWSQYNPQWKDRKVQKYSFREYENQRISLQRKIKQQPRKALLYEQLALLYASQNMLNEALVELRHATRYNASLESAWKLQAMLLGEQKQWDALINVMQKAVKHKASDPFFEKNLALAYEYYKLESPRAQKYMANYFAKGGDAYRNKIIKHFSKK